MKGCGNCHGEHRGHGGIRNRQKRLCFAKISWKVNRRMQGRLPKSWEISEVEGVRAGLSPVGLREEDCGRAGRTQKRLGFAKISWEVNGRIQRQTSEVLGDFGSR